MCLHLFDCVSRHFVVQKENFRMLRKIKYSMWGERNAEKSIVQNKDGGWLSDFCSDDKLLKLFAASWLCAANWWFSSNFAFRKNYLHLLLFSFLLTHSVFFFGSSIDTRSWNIHGLGYSIHRGWGIALIVHSYLYCVVVSRLLFFFSRKE